ncbi:hypothetical protein C8R48DRAFT_278919 [Suillus tomentosus]|nr:hypothetical protein C8R48DRAFT_278919 [Suillus tomentosus]
MPLFYIIATFRTAPCLTECQMAQSTDTGHERYATYLTSKTVSHLNDIVQQFQLVLDQCPVGYPDQAAALTNLA